MTAAVDQLCLESVERAGGGDTEPRHGKDFLGRGVGGAGSADAVDDAAAVEVIR